MSTLPLFAPAPAERVAVVCFGFEADRVRRQPWHVADGLASGASALGHHVRLFTDAADPPEGEDYEVARVPALFVRGRASRPLREALAAFGPDRVLVICGTLLLARLRALDLGAPVTLVMTSPRVKLREFARLMPQSWWREIDVLRGPLRDALVPGPLLRWGFARSGAVSVVYLSQAARTRYTALGLPEGLMLPPQVRSQAWPPAPRSVRPRIGYLGPALDLRGAWLALETFEAASRLGLDAELLLCLRPDGGRRSLLRLLRRVRRSPVRDRVRCTTAMLSAHELRERLATCHAFLLPFKVPVSEVPLVVIEAGLSGRPLVVLDAPGVSEYAHYFGGLVGVTPEALPALLLRACARTPIRPADPRPWTRWDEALEPVLAWKPSPFSRYRFVGLIGVDGSGKTFLLDRLSDGLRRAGVPHRRVWSRFRNYLSKPLLAAARLTGHNRKEQIDGVRIGYHEFAQARPLAFLFLGLQVLDQALDLVLRYRLPWRRELVVGDRCVLDTLVDLAVDTGLDDLVIDRIGPPLLRLLPRPRLAVLVSRPAALIRESRPDALLDRNFARRRALYERLAGRFGIPVLDNAGSPEAALAELHRLASAGGGAP